MFEGRLSMQVIAEQSSRLINQTQNREDSNSCQLLVEAYNRIRDLEAQNSDLLTQISTFDQQLQNQGLERELQILKEAILQRDLKIQNLEKINQKAIMDLVIIENQYNALRAVTTPQRSHLSSIPSQLNSPLSFSKINRKQSCDMQFQEEIVSLHCAKQLLKEQQRINLHREHDQWRNDQLFTFDKENLQRGFKSPQAQKTLKNCFSEVQVNKLIKKVQKQQEKSQQRQRMKHYHQYCSSIQRKYSPNSFSRKQPAHFKKSPTLTIKNQASAYKNQRSVINYGQKWAETATTTGSFFTVPNKLNFY